MVDGVAAAILLGDPVLGEDLGPRPVRDTPVQAVVDAAVHQSMCAGFISLATAQGQFNASWAQRRYQSGHTCPCRESAAVVLVGHGSYKGDRRAGVRLSPSSRHGLFHPLVRLGRDGPG
jgi:hypothetical protein